MEDKNLIIELQNIKEELRRLNWQIEKILK